MNVRELRDFLDDIEDDDLPVLTSRMFGWNDLEWVDIQEGISNRDEPDRTFTAVVLS